MTFIDISAKLKELAVKAIPGLIIKDRTFMLTVGGLQGHAYFNSRQGRSSVRVQASQSFVTSRDGWKVFRYNDALDAPKIVEKLNALVVELHAALLASADSIKQQNARAASRASNALLQESELADLAGFRGPHSPSKTAYSAKAGTNSRASSLSLIRQDDGTYIANVSGVHLKSADEAITFANFLLGGSHMNWSEAEPFEARSARMHGPRSAMGY